MNRVRIHVRTQPAFITVDSVDDLADESADPYAVLRAKTVHLAELLNCTEQEAERLILDRLGAADFA